MFCVYTDTVMIGDLTHTAMRKLIIPAMAAFAVVLGSCSTTQLAQQSTALNDDVYGTQAKAKEVTYAPVAERNYRTDEQLYGGNDYSEGDYEENIDYDFDYGYASRINRFQYGSGYRPYYDNFYSFGYSPWYGYGYDPFFMDPWAFRPGYSMWFGFGTFGGSWGYNPWGYGNRFGYGNYWGPVSYGGFGYPGYGYGYGGGYYGGVAARRSNPRPYLGSGNPGAITNGDRGTRPVGRSSNAIYNTGRGRSANGTYARPSRPTTGTTRPASGTATQSRPTRVERPAREPYVDRTPRTESSRPSSWGTGSSSSGRSSGGSSGGGGSRPNRGSR